MRFIFWWLFLSFLFAGIFYYFESEDFGEILLGSLIGNFIFLSIFWIIFYVSNSFLNFIEKSDDNFKKGLFIGLIVGFFLGKSGDDNE